MDAYLLTTGPLPCCIKLITNSPAQGLGTNVQQLLPLHQAWQGCIAGADTQRLISGFQGAPLGGAVRLILQEAAVWACSTQPQVSVREWKVQEHYRDMHAWGNTSSGLKVLVSIRTAPSALHMQAMMQQHGGRHPNKHDAGSRAACCCYQPRVTIDALRRHGPCNRDSIGPRQMAQDIWAPSHDKQLCCISKHGLHNQQTWRCRASKMRQLTVVNRQALGRPVADLPAQVQLGPRDKVGVWPRPEACLNVLGGAGDHLPILRALADPHEGLQQLVL